MYELVVFYVFVIWMIVLVGGFGDVEVGDCDDFEVVFVEVVDYGF